MSVAKCGCNAAEGMAAKVLFGLRAPCRTRSSSCLQDCCTRLCTPSSLHHVCIVLFAVLCQQLCVASSLWHVWRDALFVLLRLTLCGFFHISLLLTSLCVAYPCALLGVHFASLILCFLPAFSKQKRRHKESACGVLLFALVPMHGCILPRISAPMSSQSLALPCFYDSVVDPTSDHHKHASAGTMAGPSTLPRPSSSQSWYFLCLLP